MNINLSVRRTIGNTILFTVPDRQTFVLRAVWLNVITGRAYIRITGPGITAFDIIGLDSQTTSVPDPPAVEEPPPPPEEDSVFHRHKHKAEPAKHETKAETPTPAPRGMTTNTPVCIAFEIDYMEFRSGTVISLDLDSSNGMVSAGISGSTSS